VLAAVSPPPSMTWLGQARLGVGANCIGLGRGNFFLGSPSEAVPILEEGARCRRPLDVKRHGTSSVR
jgi:hypothetical protein